MLQRGPIVRYTVSINTEGKIGFPSCPRTSNGETCGRPGNLGFAKVYGEYFCRHDGPPMRVRKGSSVFWVQSGKESTLDLPVCMWQGVRGDRERAKKRKHQKLRLQKVGFVPPCKSEARHV